MQNYEQAVGEFLETVETQYHQYIIKRTEEYLYFTVQDLDRFLEEAKEEEAKKVRQRADFIAEHLTPYDSPETSFALRLRLDFRKAMKYGFAQDCPDSDLALTVNWAKEWFGKEGVRRVRVKESEESARIYHVTLWFDNIEDEVFWKLKYS